MMTPEQEQELKHLADEYASDSFYNGAISKEDSFQKLKEWIEKYAEEVMAECNDIPISD